MGVAGWKAGVGGGFLTNFVPSPKEILGLMLCYSSEEMRGRINGPRSFSF